MPAWAGGKRRTLAEARPAADLGVRWLSPARGANDAATLELFLTATELRNPPPLPSHLRPLKRR